MKALIIGAGGFVGGYLIAELAERGCDITATKLAHERINSGGSFSEQVLDILDESAISAVLAQAQPDCIFHLAAQSSVALSWKNPALTVDINIRGSVNLLEAIRKSGTNPRVMLIGSGEEYGFSAGSNIAEDTLPQPANIYALTKYTQNMLGQVYHRAYGMDIISVRAFNHIGAGQQPTFVAADFCRQTAEIEAGRQAPVIRVGNLSAKRDFTDVRDIVRAYCDLIEHGKSGETYNVGSGKAIAISELLDMILSLSDVKIAVECDEARMRPSDIPEIRADITKLQRDTSWAPEIPLKDSLKSILDYFRR